MFAYSARLFLRPLWSDDLSVLLDLLETASSRSGSPDSSDNDVTRYLRDNASRLIRETDITRPHSGVFLRSGKEPRLIGITALAGTEAHFFCWIAPAFRGNGFATEASKMMLHFADNALRLPMLTAAYDHEDEAAEKLLTKLGFSEKQKNPPTAAWGAANNSVSFLPENFIKEERVRVLSSSQMSSSHNKLQTILNRIATLAA
ncbi:RimJ/RimL family protein N-acetyltransferase [Zymomonas mobilis]|uniref:RimJ/RimL family protein N-acetyltransferase n=1 Tax=Zymomonas mobilis TaxID=542 RepID=A0A542VZJ0_ZYMMB|nr:GNAT family N-acetyltransferase [Zymomonas mobilis]TQL16746.1 RimJ/RimL family protein N-acetyltransferase [Zymomonas mobilis]